ncbi:6946_t:CDS:2, partial [Cetraspora pellucida]
MCASIKRGSFQNSEEISSFENQNSCSFEEIKVELEEIDETKFKNDVEFDNESEIEIVKKITIKSSSHHHFHLQCKRGGQPHNTLNLTVDTRQRKRMSKCCGCPFILKAALKNFKWQVTEITNEHNHPMAKDEKIFYEHHQLTCEARSTAVRMLKAGAKPSMIYEAMRDEDGQPTVTRKDISNLGLRINFLEENASMEALIIGMKERGYTLCLHYEENSLQNENKCISINPLLVQDDKKQLELLLEKVSQFVLNKIK